MHFFLFIPELYYFSAFVVCFCLSLVKHTDSKRDYIVALSLSSAGVVICLASVHLDGTLFAGTYQVDLFSQVFKVLLSLGLFLVICICSELEGVAKQHHPEFYALLFVCTLAMMLLVSCVHLLSIFIALELSSYSLYILVALRKDRNVGIEAGIKYFLVGVTASAIMLFGLAILYGTVKATYIREIVQILPGMIHRPMAAIGLLLTLSGFFFKLAVFPFHFWAPDVYQGATNQVSAYIATASKVAAMAILMRFVALSGGNDTYLVHILVILSIVSMTLGNMAAIVQKDLKRMLAYSSVAQAGYVLIGILSMNADGYAATIFYALAVVVMKFTCFLVLVKVAFDGHNLDIAQLAGLHRRSPILAMALMFAVLGLAGIPPTIGFTGKLLIFAAALEEGFFVLVLIAMINVVISLYYYLIVVKAAYLLEPKHPLPALVVSIPVKILTGTLVLAMVVAGIYPHYFIEIARSAARLLI